MYLKKGFSLLELMIVVAIIGIIAAVALPSYKSYIQRGKATEAVNFLASTSLQMEQRLQDTGGYVCAAPTVIGKYFSYTCISVNDPILGSAYTLTANGTNSMSEYRYTYNEKSDRITTKHPKISAPSPCWLISGTEC